MNEQIKTAARLIREADTILVSAGAGLGVDSGLPDFRGNEGFWKAYPLLQEENLSFQDLANPDWFLDDPSRAWGFYGHRFNLYRSTLPHLGFSLLKKWCDLKDVPYFVFTSNVDGHFQKSGFSEDQIYECHGSINHLQCANSCSKDIWDANDLVLDVELTTLRATSKLPVCPKCGGVARPNILMFGDADWLPLRAKQQNQRYRQWKDMVKDMKVVVIELGAGKSIPTVRDASEALNASLIRINPRESDGPKNTVSISMRALEALQEIDSEMA